MKLLKVKKDKSLWVQNSDGSKETIGNCDQNDIMLYLNEKSNFYDSDNLNHKNFLYRILHPKFGDCWLWANNKSDIKWLNF
jgi:hypothetical protein